MTSARAAYEAVRETLIRYSTQPVEVQATMVFGALMDLPVEQRMEAMGMEGCVKPFFTSDKATCWREARP